MEKKTKQNEENKSENTLETTLEFLEKTKEGLYAPIDFSLIEKGRAPEETVLPAEIYIYNISSN
jgi:hypothetical protein